MRYATRTFLWSFVPIAFLLVGSFWTIQTLALSTIYDGLRTSLRQAHVAVGRAQAKSEAHNSRVLRIVGESPSLKAGLQLMALEPGNNLARLTVEDQLREITKTLGFDFLLVSEANGKTVSGVLRSGERISPMDLALIRLPQRGFFTVGGRTYQVTSVPIDQGEENLGMLSVGEYFDLSAFSGPVVLARNGKILGSSIPGASFEEVESALNKCKQNKECEVRVRGETYLAMPMEGAYSSGYQLRTLQSIDSAIAPVRAILGRVFVLAGLGALLAASVLSALSSRSIVKPISVVIDRLRESEQTGVLTEFQTEPTSVKEIRELMRSFDRAAAAIREGRASLHRAYVEFVGSLAHALDARDCYTAGHSHRVSDMSCAVGQAINLSKEDLDEIRVGALLHDIGKIGISDSVLQKPGPLTSEEFATIKLHPTIGRKILEGVHGFQVYLPTVELHHEDWDGGGYPLGLRGEETPLAARIVHVADAYDAMTSDRPYRRGMDHERAIRVLEENAGSQFDPAIVPVFRRISAGFEKREMPHHVQPLPVHEVSTALSMEKLAAAVNSASPAVPLTVAGGK